MKSQTVRLVDVFALGPFMIWFGSRSQLPNWAKTLMVLSGIGTVVFNGVNYLRVRQEANSAVRSIRDHS